MKGRRSRTPESARNKEHYWLSSDDVPIAMLPCVANCTLCRKSRQPVPIVPPIPPLAKPGHNLPAQATPLFGRSEDVLAVSRQLARPEVRLLTLTGTGGVGKTRLALAVAEAISEVFADGVYLVELEHIQHSDLVIAVIAAALGLPEPRSQPLLPYLADCLRERTLLLILDNFEHVLAASEQLASLLSLCPSIKILATSRAPLRIRWEHIFRVGPIALPMPETAGDLAHVADAPAVRLFVERARAANPGFELTPQNAAAITEVCTRLDGLPLAIELAAARSRLLPPQTMLARLDDRLDWLVDAATDRPSRHRTLRKALDYSFDLLPQDEQAFFLRLSVFAGGCTPQAAMILQTGQDASTSPVVGTLDRLDSLAQKSLLQQESYPDGQVRFRMLETVREWALERLAGSGDLQATRECWIDYHVALAAHAGSALLGHSQGECLDALDRGQDNLRSALRWCVDTGDAARGLELVRSLWRFWYLRGSFVEGRTWLTQMLDLPAARAKTLGRAEALSAAGELAYTQGDVVAAEAFQREGLSIYRELEDQRGVAGSLDTLGRLACREGDPAQARHLFEESLAFKREMNDAWGVADVLRNLGGLAAGQGQYATARSRYEGSLVEWQTLGDLLSAARVFESMAILAQSQGQSARALRLGGASAALRERLGTPCGSPPQLLRLQSSLEAAQLAIGPETSVVTIEEGRQMSFAEAVEYARTRDEYPPRPSGPRAPPITVFPSAQLNLAGLTAREREVATLLLRGKTNRQLAEALVITERTAETHVCRILNKLGLGSRAQIAALLMDQQLGSRSVS